MLNSFFLWLKMYTYFTKHGNTWEYIINNPEISTFTMDLIFLVIVCILKCKAIYSDSVLASSPDIWTSLALLIWVLVKYLCRFVTECTYLPAMEGIKNFRGHINWKYQNIPFPTSNCLYAMKIKDSTKF